MGLARQSSPISVAPDWWQDWSWQTAVVIASGPSASHQAVDLARGHAKVVTVNSSWQLAPWADVHVATDDAWWEVHHRDMEKFAGLKLCGEQATARKYGVQPLLVRRHVADLMVLGGYEVASANSGFTAVNLAAQMGAARILLVGFDCRIDQGLHWHGKHDQRLNNPDLGRTTRWKSILDAAAGQLAAHGCEVINCSAVSALTAYPKASLEAVLCRG